MRYAEIPVYLNEECTDLHSTFYIPILNKGELNTLIETTFTNTVIGGWNSESSTELNYPGAYDAYSGSGNSGKYLVRYSGTGIKVYANNDIRSAPVSFTPASFIGVKGLMHTSMTGKVPNEFISESFDKSKYNFLRYIDLVYDDTMIGKVLYLKNGCSFMVNIDDANASVRFAVIHFYYNKIEVQASKFIIAYKNNQLFNVSNVYMSSSTSEGQADLYSKGSCYSNAFSSWMLFDDMTGISYNDIPPLYSCVYSFKVLSNGNPAYIRGGYSENTWYRYREYSQNGHQCPSNTWFKFNNSKSIEENVADLNGEIKEENTDPDNENTYPGGGNDQNQYPEDGTSGKGTFDNRNDPIDFPDMPLWDATSTGFISLWNPTISEITQLYGFLWDSDISTTLKKLFLEPMDAIISLAFFPVKPTLFPAPRNVTIGHVDTGINMKCVQKQFVDFDFGEIEVDEYYGAAWDYSPYTHASIYLPYIGVQAIDVDDVMKGTLHLKYRIDLLSGMCSAMLKVDRSRDGLGAIIYTWQGNCAMFVPVTAGSAREFINSIIQIGAMAGVAMAQPAAGAIEARANRDVENYKAPSLGGNWINPAMSAYSTLNVLGQKVHVQRGGRVDSNAGVMSPQQAYIILSRPVSAIPKGWNKYAGYPSLKIKKLSTQKGYTEIAYIKLNNLEATAEEISELNSILRGGVIL